MSAPSVQPNCDPLLKQIASTAEELLSSVSATIRIEKGQVGYLAIIKTEDGHYGGGYTAGLGSQVKEAEGKLYLFSSWDKLKSAVNKCGVANALAFTGVGFHVGEIGPLPDALFVSGSLGNLGGSVELGEFIWD